MELTIKSKLIGVGTLLAFIPAVMVSVALSLNTLNSAKSGLRDNAISQLSAVRDSTAHNIETYFSYIQKQVITMSSNKMIKDAIKNIVPAYNDYAKTLSANELAKRKNNLKNYYINDFNDKFIALNNNESADPSHLIAQFTPSTIALQSAYISRNPAALGEKDNMDKAEDDHPYHQIHQSIHPSIRQYLKAFNYYDIFLVDAKSGDIVYSVFKELDFATSLKNGPYANSGIGQAFSKALNATASNQSFLTDFAPYLPSYNAQASFISSAIYDKDKIIGVLIFQMPIDKINDVMNHNNQWEEVGLGNSGETYLVGSDFTMRSNGRFFIEDKPGYLSLMKSTGTPEVLIRKLDQTNSTIGIQTVKTEGVNAALKGSEGSNVFEDYRGINVVSAYKPLNLGNLQWALMSEIDEAEASLPVKFFKKSIYKNTFIVCSIALLLGACLSWLFAKVLLKPINKMQKTVYDIAEGENDLTKRLTLYGNNEVTVLSEGINTFIEKIDNTFSELLKSVARMVPMSKDLGDVNKVLNETSLEQKQVADNINECLIDTNSSTSIVNTSLKEIKLSSANGQNVVNQSELSIKQATSLMDNLSSDMGAAVQAIDKLQNDTNKITSIIDVINSIADQTNLLALNAAIEAARAGEAGRGFAVVADEVRSLASKTSESTLQVTDMVNAIQSGTQTVVDFIQKGQTSVEETNQQVGTTSLQLTDISTAMSDILVKVDDINEAINSQKSQFEKVNDQYELMNLSFEKSVEGSAAANKVGADLDKLGEKLLSMIEKFKVSDSAWSTQRRNKLRE